MSAKYSQGAKFAYLVGFLLLPFAVASAFKFTDWLGWPSLLIGGWLWAGCALIICGDKS